DSNNEESAAISKRRCTKLENAKTRQCKQQRKQYKKKYTEMDDDNNESSITTGYTKIDDKRNTFTC
ncbi:25582_t:CDS:1, partial [Gigaspora rosea]